MQIRTLFTCDGCGVERLDQHESRCDCMDEQGTWTESQISMLPVNIDFANPIYQVLDNADSGSWRTVTDEGYEQYTKDGVTTRIVYAEFRGNN